MQRNSTLFQELKRTGWDNRTAWQNAHPDQKLLSTYAINKALQEPKDWDAIALKCSNNPNHEMFGLTVEAIRLEWSSRGKKGQNRGLKLEDYIDSKLAHGGQVDIAGIEDPKLLSKMGHFDNLYDTVLSRMHSWIGTEIWLTSKVLGLSVRCDSLFLAKDSPQICLIAEWKNTESIATSNRFEKLIGPASHLYDCEWVNYTIQFQIYQYILLEYGIFDEIIARCFQFKTTGYETLGPAFDFDPTFIEAIVNFTRIEK